LRDQFGILPPGDIRRALVALSKDTGMVRKLFEYRFKESTVKGHTIGNLLLTALADITGDFEEGIDVLSQMFNVQGKVIPVTKEKTQIGVTLENGEQIIGEVNIDIPKHDGNIQIQEAFLVEETDINPKAREALLNSDYIIIGPGDLYTSIVPNLLANGMKETITKSHAKVIYVCNIMTKFGETTDFCVEDFIAVIEKYLGRNQIDYVLVNNGIISEELTEKYAKLEQKIPVKIKNPDICLHQSFKIIERDLVNEEDYIRHSPKKLSAVINDFLEGWIK